MFSNCYTAKQRLCAWRDLRNSFSEVDDVDDVVRAFANVSLENRYIDYYTPDSWPNVFDIVSEGHICQSGLTLIVAATLHHLGFIKSDKITLDIVSNHITGSEGLVLRDQDIYYNFLPGEISSKDFVKEHGLIYDSHIITVDKLFS